MALYVVKPVGTRWKLRLDHPLSNGLAFAVPDVNAPVDVISGKTGVVNSGVDVTLVSPIGGAAKFPGSNTTGAIRFTGVRPIPANGTCTVMVFANPANESLNGALISQRNSAGSRQVTMYTNTGASFALSAGKVSLHQITSNSTYNNAAGPTIISGNWEWYGASSEGTAASTNTRYYLNGVLKSTVANVFTSGALNIDEDLWLGAPAGYTGNPQYSHNQGIASAFIWNRVLTDNEIASFVADPWAMFEEEQPLIVAAAPAVGAELLSSLSFDLGIGSAVLTQPVTSLTSKFGLEFGLPAANLGEVAPTDIDLSTLVGFGYGVAATFATGVQGLTSEISLDFGIEASFINQIGLTAAISLDQGITASIASPVSGVVLTSIVGQESGLSPQLSTQIVLSSVISSEMSLNPRITGATGNTFTFLDSAARFNMGLIPDMQFKRDLWLTIDDAPADWQEIPHGDNSTEDSTVQ